MQSILPKPASASLTSLDNSNTLLGILNTKFTLQMERPTSAKGKKRARDSSPSSSLSSIPSDAPAPAFRVPVKKPKRAETRPCPGCAELIPVRLLAAHAALEMQRVEDIIRHIGETEVLAEVDDLEEGPSNRARRSALKARKSLTTSTPSSSTSPSAIGKTIQTITRRRKARHQRLKELAKEDEAESWVVEVGGGTSCPVCAQVVRGDRDVVEAHVDACLAHASARLEREQVEEEEELDIGGGGSSVRTRVITSASLRGTGIHVRTSNSVDVEDEVDIDGEDEAVFGEAQFGEADVLALPSSGHDVHPENEDIDVDIDGQLGITQEQQTLRHLVVEGKVFTKQADGSVGIDIQPTDMDQLDLAISTGRSRNDPSVLIVALENKIKALVSPEHA
ncbi:hypothetical protein AZE42_00419 [Rhizopogon vesiculosus]|uniref:E3 ubiquitin-protein ligase RNF220 middle domain-containing protein n=1 Tax=Rhizopogon vesiculosus TaxID=180088 RepID=A0A1J8QHA0_9AGAM|nr:hypothetical protein AZE42_00419 [Rhizopogon vesiculosus]